MSVLRSSIDDSPSVMRKPTMSVTMMTKVMPMAPTIVRSRCDSRSQRSRSACILSFNVMTLAPSRTRRGDGEIELFELARLRLLARGRRVARRRRRHRRDLALLRRLEALDLVELRRQVVDLRRGFDGAFHINLFWLYFELRNIEFSLIARWDVARDLVEDVVSGHRRHRRKSALGPAVQLLRHRLAVDARLAEQLDGLLAQARLQRLALLAQPAQRRGGVDRREGEDGQHRG